MCRDRLRVARCQSRTSRCPVASHGPAAGEPRQDQQKHQGEPGRQQHAPNSEDEEDGEQADAGRAQCGEDPRSDDQARGHDETEEKRDEPGGVWSALGRGRRQLYAGALAGVIVTSVPMVRRKTP